MQISLHNLLWTNLLLSLFVCAEITAARADDPGKTITWSLRDEFQTVSPGDFDIFQVTDSLDEAVQIVWEAHIGQRVVAPELPRFATDDEERVSGDGTRGGPRHRRRGGDSWHESAI